MKKGRTRTILRWIIGIFAVLVLLVVAAIAFKNPLLRAIICWNISRNTGLQTTIDRFVLDLPRLQITQLHLRNSPAFGGSVFVDIPEIFCEVDSESVANGKFRFKEVRFNLSEANIVRNTNGLTNIEALKKAMEKESTKPGRPHTNNFEFGGIDKLVVSLGKVNFIDLKEPSNNTQVNLGVNQEVVRDLKTEEDLQNWATALVIRLAIQQSFSGGGQRSGKALENLLKELK